MGLKHSNCVRHSKRADCVQAAAQLDVQDLERRCGKVHAEFVQSTAATPQQHKPRQKPDTQRRNVRNAVRNLLLTVIQHATYRRMRACARWMW